MVILHSVDERCGFDPDVNRINYEDHGNYLGEFSDQDSILVVLKNGDFYITNFDATNHYEDNILRIEKFVVDKPWTAVIYDADNQGYPYLKRSRWKQRNGTRTSLERTLIHS